MRFLSIPLLGGALLALAGVADAGVIEIGLQEPGVNGSALTTIAISGSGSAGVTGKTYGGFTVNNISVQGTTNPGALFSNSLNTTSSAAGTLTVEISLQGITYPVGFGTFTSGFTSNEIPAGWSVTETTWLSPNNALYGESTLIGTQTFTSIGTVISNDYVTTGAGPFSVTEVYVISATAGGGSTNNTINVVDPPGSVTTPEPGSLALLGAGLVSLAMVRRRLSRSAI